MIQSGQMLPQQQIMMQANQPIHMPPCKKFLLFFLQKILKCRNHVLRISHLRNENFCEAIHGMRFSLR